MGWLTAAWVVVKGALSTVGTMLVEWEVPAAFVALGLALGAGGTLYVQGRFHEAEDLAQRVVRDTVERQITKTDTVTKTRPVRVTVYDTVRATEIDTAFVPIPTDMTIRGVTPERPVQVEGQRFTLIEWRPSEQRFTQTTYRADPDRWAVDIKGSLTGARRSVSAIGTVGLRYEHGPWAARIGGGVGAGVVSTSAAAGPVGTVSLRYDLLSFDLFN